MKQIWKPVGNVEIESLGSNKFVFPFFFETDRKRVLYTGPWCFDKNLIVLTEPTGIEDLAQQSFTHVSFWIQIHNLPIMCMNRDVGTMLGQMIGEIEEVESRQTKACLGKYMRVRVKIDITKPLKCSLRVQLEGEEQLSTLLIRYERLPNFCFHCRLIGHVQRECLQLNLNNSVHPGQEMKYKPWIRATTIVEQSKQLKAEKATLEEVSGRRLEAVEWANTNTSHKNSMMDVSRQQIGGNKAAQAVVESNNSLNELHILVSDRALPHDGQTGMVSQLFNTEVSQQQFGPSPTSQMNPNDSPCTSNPTNRKIVPTTQQQTHAQRGWK
ncbi:Zinc CCHC-type-like protein [Melia azedarach]|uniref:Zinc CCHC-type-like protein n=1 Tax=Melia azedarach TaxID=155640 RepID=A0ACC1X5I4_MELAZ|nr:Zinc CCHC-type-like protein [Melia azedarach]